MSVRRDLSSTTRAQFDRDRYPNTNIIQVEGVISVGVDTQPVCELTLNLK